jgi:hypothetical protein
MTSMSTTNGLIVGTAANPANTTTVHQLDDQNNWMVRFRVHRDFYP